jgi:uncharacterized protein YdhG (YjbR/CyaY superfamily)
MQLVDVYISNLEIEKREWMCLIVNFMREAFPEWEETFDNKMPTYKGDRYFIAFAAQKTYFYFYTDDPRGLSLIMELLPNAFRGKNCVRIKYNNKLAIEAMMDVCKEIIDHNQSKRSSAITDMKALKKWSKISSNVQQMLMDNAFCPKCGMTTIINYGVQNDRLGLVLKGSCKKCGGGVARFVEDE